MDATEEIMTSTFYFLFNYVTFLGLAYASRFLIHDLFHGHENEDPLQNRPVVSKLATAASELLNDVTVTKENQLNGDEGTKNNQMEKERLEMERIAEVEKLKILQKKEEEIRLKLKKEKEEKIIQEEAERQEQLRRDQLRVEEEEAERQEQLRKDQLRVEAEEAQKQEQLKREQDEKQLEQEHEVFRQKLEQEDSLRSMQEVSQALLEQERTEGSKKLDQLPDDERQTDVFFLEKEYEEAERLKQIQFNEKEQADDVFLLEKEHEEAERIRELLQPEENMISPSSNSTPQTELFADERAQPNVFFLEKEYEEAERLKQIQFNEKEQADDVFLLEKEHEEAERIRELLQPEENMISPSSNSTPQTELFADERAQPNVFFLEREYEVAHRLNEMQFDETKQTDIFLLENEYEEAELMKDENAHLPYDGYSPHEELIKKTHSKLSESSILKSSPEFENMNSINEQSGSSFEIIVSPCEDAESTTAPRSSKEQTAVKNEKWRDQYGLLMEGISDFYDFQASTNPSRSRQNSRQSSPATTVETAKDGSRVLSPAEMSEMRQLVNFLRVERHSENEKTSTEDSAQSSSIKTQPGSRSRSRSPLPTPDNLKRGLENRRAKMVQQNEMVFQKLGVKTDDSTHQNDISQSDFNS